MKKFDVTIIGSGLSGLVCGNILSKEGFNVCVIEKHHTPGGNLQSFIRHGHSFDTGVHYIGSMGEGQTLNRYWKYLGITGNLSLQPLDADGFDHIRFGDDEFPIAQHPYGFIDRLSPLFPGSRSVLEAYIKDLQIITEASPLYHLQVPEDNHEQRYRTAGAMDWYRTLGGNVFSRNGRIPLSAVLAGNNYLYAGSEATPQHTAAIINHSFLSGAYRIVGGSSGIAQLLTNNIRTSGGMVLTHKEIVSIRDMNQKFLVESHDGELFLSNLLISSIHPQKTLQMMPENMVRSSFRKRINSLVNTSASFILHLGLKPEKFPYLNRNYYMHNSTDVWRNPPARDTDWPEMALLSTPCQRAGQIFAETATVLTYSNYNDYLPWERTSVGKRGGEYLEMKQSGAGKLLAFVARYFPDLPGAISHMEISTPLTYRDYTGIPEGSLYGIRKDYRDPLMTTLLPKTKIPNFYFTGQNTNIHGVLGVTIAAVMTCGEILGIESLLKKIRNG